VAERSATFVVEDAQDIGQRLDRFLADHLSDTSRSQIQRLIKRGEVTVDGATSKPSYAVASGDRIVAALPDTTEPPVQAEPIPLHVVYEDQHLLAVNKPAGMVVHPALGHPSGTLVNALLAYLPSLGDIGGRRRAGLVHRLDMETSGILLVAKDEAAYLALKRLFKRRRVHKTYLALVEGQVQPQEGIIDVPIGRDPRDRKRMAPVRDGRPSRTHYRVRESFAEQTLLEAHPRSGRTHQVRVHFSWFGHPVVGDQVYGHRRSPLLEGRHFLHALELSFRHPVRGEEVTLHAPLPEELEALLRTLRAQA
jgi:23S rRNA pseudouridine1911/1915/1917 synthase